MVDNNARPSDPVVRRAEAMNLTSRAALTMLVVENPNDVMELIRPILMRYAGDQALSENEMTLCQYFNDCVVAREDDGFDQRREV